MDKLEIGTNGILYLGNCKDIMDNFIEESSVNLVCTSPPYSSQKSFLIGKTPYQGAPEPDKFNDWFLPITASIYRVLKDDGVFCLNIAEVKRNFCVHPFLYELLLRMQDEQKWIHINTYLWRKTAFFPGGEGHKSSWKYRAPSGFEYCYWWQKKPVPRFNQDQTRRPYAQGSLRRGAKMTAKKYCQRDYEEVVNKPVDFNPLGAVCDNVIELAPVTSSDHSAPFPIGLPEFFIKASTSQGDVVLDPFMGSGTTARAAHRLKRKWIGIEIVKEYMDRMVKDLDFVERDERQEDMFDKNVVEMSGQTVMKI